METLIQDIRFSLRIFYKKPAFTLVVLLTVAIGIGANTAIFSVIKSVLLRPLEYKEADRIVMAWESIPHLGLGRSVISMPDFIDWKDQNRVFEKMSAYSWNPYTLTGGEPEQVRGLQVASNFFDVLGGQAYLGRTFEPTEERDRLVVLSYGLWQRRFGSDPDIIGQAMRMSGQGFTIIGVMPRSFSFPTKEYQLWTTLESIWAEGPDLTTKRGKRFLRVIAQLKPGVTPEKAQAEMSSIAARIEQQDPANTGVGVKIDTLNDVFVGDIRPALLILMGVVGFVLLIACANLANIQLARTATREREMAIRTALGASRKRLVRQLLTESILLSLIGGGLGLLLAVWGVDLLVGINPGNIPRLDGVGLDGWLLGFAILISLITGVLFGLAPALQVSKADLNVTLKEGGRGLVGSSRGKRIQGSLVILEVAISLVLLIGAGLMSKSFIKLSDIDPGFNPDNLLTFDLNSSRAIYPKPEQQVNLFRNVVERIESVPGVQSVAMCESRPLDSVGRSESFMIRESPVDVSTQSPLAAHLPISPNFFRMMGIPLLNGREFTDADREGATPVVIINEQVARQFLPGQDPIGKQLKQGGEKSTSPWHTIVGMVKDVKFKGLSEDVGYSLYFPYAQQI